MTGPTFLAFDVTKLPSTVTLEWQGRKLSIVCRRNPQMDRYTLDIYDASGAPIVFGRVLAYGRDALFGVAHVHTSGLGVMPFDPAWEDDGKDAGAETFMRTVLPYLIPRWE